MISSHDWNRYAGLSRDENPEQEEIRALREALKRSQAFAVALTEQVERAEAERDIARNAARTRERVARKDAIAEVARLVDAAFSPVTRCWEVSPDAVQEAIAELWAEAEQ